MGGVVASICSPSNSKNAKTPPAKAAQPVVSIAGYDWSPKSAEAPTKELPLPSVQNETEPPLQSEPESEPKPAPEPQPAPEPKPAPTTPITLETMQGDWVNSMGAKINVNGTEVSLNGLLMKMHPIMLNEDGTVCSIGRIWQLKGWLPDEKIEFKESPSREVMEFARSVIWTKATAERMEIWTEQMKGLGYMGSAKDPLKRGVDGCCPGTCDAKAKIVVDGENKDKEELKTLNRLIEEWRLPGLLTVPPRRVIPDYSNRGHTGISVEHVHYLATSFKDKGFQKRQGNKGHDIPVLVQEPTNSELGKKSIANWRSKLADEPGFPPKEHYERLFKEMEFYTSLGNGHFFQALNLCANECDTIYGNQKFRIGGDLALQEAIEEGVSSIVLKSGVPLRDRETISKLLNSKHEYRWNVGPDGSVNIQDAEENMSTSKQFEAMSKVLDSVELNCLVRAELGVKDSHRIGQ